MSGFLLDTNVISELVRPNPEPKVKMWIEASDENLLFLSVLTIGEIRKRIMMLTNASRRVRLESWLEGELVVRFSGRILPVDQAVADRWGRIAGQVDSKSPFPVIDALLAATALQYNLTLVTRNTRDIATGIPVFNPWTD